MSDLRNPDRLGAAVRHAIAPIAPPAALEARALAAVELDVAGPRAVPSRTRSWMPRRPFLAFAGAAAAAAVLAIALLGRGGAAGELELRAVLAAPTGVADASVEVRKTGIGRVVTFRSESLPILPKGEYYELWFVGPEDRPGNRNRISAGTFHPDENGRSHVVFAAAVDPALYPTLSVTAEPGDGDPAPTGPEVLRYP